MNMLNLVFTLYRKLHMVAPSTDAGRRFLLDIASWGAFLLVERCSRNIRPGPDTEAECLALASLAAIGYRSGPTGWLDEQFRRASETLKQPNARQRGDAVARQWAMSLMTEAQKKAAAETEARWAVQNAASRSDLMDGAIHAATSYVRATGAFDKGSALHAAVFPSATQQKLLDKLRDSLNKGVSFQLAKGDPTGAALLAGWVNSDEPDTLFAAFEVPFDDSWIADHELASEDAEEAANFERHAHEDQRIRDEIAARNRDPERYNAEMAEKLDELTSPEATGLLGYTG